jgi:hypothetical protein
MDECLDLLDDQGQVDVVEVSPVEAGASRLLGEVEDDGVRHVGNEARGGWTWRENCLTVLQVAMSRSWKVMIVERV